jgi:hemolysin activation/secretion protein
LASRPDASGKFTKATLALQVARGLGERVTVRGTAVAQYANRPLLSAEEFALGGNRVGRAFDFNARTGDRGVGAGVELSYRVGEAKDRTGLEVFGFADGGIARDLPSPVTPGATQHLASAGAGARFSLSGTTIAVETAVPLAGARRPRLFASVFRSF